MAGEPLQEVPVFANAPHKVQQNEAIKALLGTSLVDKPVTMMRKDGGFFVTIDECRLPEFYELLSSMEALEDFHTVDLPSLTIHLVDTEPVDASGVLLSPTGFLSHDEALPILTSARLVSHLMKSIVIYEVSRLLCRPQFKLTLLADGQIALQPGEIAVRPRLRYDGNSVPFIDIEVFTL